jgi:hypothetical protein
MHATTATGIDPAGRTEGARVATTTTRHDVAPTTTV